MKELTGIHELEVIEDWKVLLVLANFKVSNGGDVVLHGLSNDIE